MFDGMPVGYFEEMPRSSGLYRYIPYRGSGHFDMWECHHSGGSPRCFYDTDTERVSFVVRDGPEYGVLDLDDFVISPRETLA